MSDFVKPEPVRLSLGDGQYIDVKKRLNHGETEDMFARWAPFIVPGQETHLDRREVRTAKVLTYLLGWSLTNDGQPVPYTPDMPETARTDLLRSLDPDRFDEIHKAVQAHEQTQAEARAAKKKILSGAIASSETSASPDAATGATNGSPS